ncbi:uncharacterized protein Ecym_6182 [Eremothecium cymbalariae DBVPG|uniref:Uncharacterized protein n=1 Tax=Eremothecium cymbalariae (strain CBS 270.75 / DBVPG 7215 / KCTC 17166 / NRRL Y-17582) TaxID=931890 RepID=G8JV86_ERECY|nr:hypothetical protein Ecym_6182 [Eremothecium cymbalariae DBVPG\
MIGYSDHNCAAYFDRESTITAIQRSIQRDKPLHYDSLHLKGKLRQHFKMPVGIRNSLKQSYYKNLEGARASLVHASESYHEACEGARFKFYRALADTRQILHEMRDTMDNLRFEAQLWRYDHISSTKLGWLFKSENATSNDILYCLRSTSRNGQLYRETGSRPGDYFKTQTFNNKVSIIGPRSDQTETNSSSSPRIILSTDEDAFGDVDNNFIFSAPPMFTNVEYDDIGSLLKSNSAPVELVNDSAIINSGYNFLSNRLDLNNVLNPKTVPASQGNISQIETVRKMTDIVIQMFDQYVNNNSNSNNITNKDKDNNNGNYVNLEEYMHTDIEQKKWGDIDVSNKLNLNGVVDVHTKVEHSTPPRTANSICDEIDRLNSMIESTISMYRDSEEDIHSTMYHPTDASDQKTNHSSTVSRADVCKAGARKLESHPMSLLAYSSNATMEDIEDILARVVEQLNQFESNGSPFGLLDNTFIQTDDILNDTVKSLEILNEPEPATVPSENSQVLHKPSNWCTVRHIGHIGHTGHNVQDDDICCADQPEFEITLESELGPKISFDLTSSPLKISTHYKSPTEREKLGFTQHDYNDEDSIYDDIHQYERLRFDQMPISLKTIFKEYPPYIYEKRLLKPLPPSLKVLFQDPQYDYNWKDSDPKSLKPYHATLDPGWEINNLFRTITLRNGCTLQSPMGYWLNKCWFCGHHIYSRFHNCRREYLKKHIHNGAEYVRFQISDFCEDFKLEIEWALYKIRYELF